MKQYNLLDGLFAAKPQQSAQTDVQRFTCVTGTKQRTFKIEERHWEEFLILVRIEGEEMTQAKLLNQLIREAVEKNRDRIEEYKSNLKK